MSVNNTSPEELFGGTWEQLKDRFLLGAGSTYTNGNTGGSATVTLTANQSGVPAHNHGMAHTHSHAHKIRYLSNSGSGTNRRNIIAGGSSEGDTLNSATDATPSSKSSTDNNTAKNATEAHNNMPPYLVVYMWKRTA